MFGWVRKLVRKNTSPIPVQDAARWRLRLSLAYTFISMNAFIIVIYCCTQGKADWAKYYGLKSETDRGQSPAYEWADTLKMKNVKVYRISGLNVVEKFDSTNVDVNKTDGSSRKVGGPPDLSD